jgi:hypothetical protein
VNDSEHLRNVQLLESMDALPFDDQFDCPEISRKVISTMADDIAHTFIHLSQHAGQPRYIDKQSIFSLARTSLR